MDVSVSLPVYPIPRSFAPSSVSTTAVTTSFGGDSVTKNSQDSRKFAPSPLFPLPSSPPPPLTPLLIADNKSDQQNLKDSTSNSLLAASPKTVLPAAKLERSLNDTSVAPPVPISPLKQSGDISTSPAAHVFPVNIGQVDELKSNENRFTRDSPFESLLNLKRDIRVNREVPVPVPVPIPVPDAEAADREAQRKREHRKQHLSPAGSATGLLVPVTQLQSRMIAPMRGLQSQPQPAVSQFREHNSNQSLVVHPQFVAAESHQQQVQYTRVSIPLYYTHPIAAIAGASVPIVRHSSEREVGGAPPPPPQQQQQDQHLFMAHQLMPHEVRRAPFDSVIQANAEALLMAQQRQQQQRREVVQQTRRPSHPQKPLQQQQPFYQAVVQVTRDQSQHRTDYQPVLLMRQTSTSNMPEPASESLHVAPIMRHSLEGVLSSNSSSRNQQLQQFAQPDEQRARTQAHSNSKHAGVERAVSSSSAPQTHVVNCRSSPSDRRPVSDQPPIGQQRPYLDSSDSSNSHHMSPQDDAVAKAERGERPDRSRARTRSSQRTSVSSTSAAASLSSPRMRNVRRENSAEDSGSPSPPAFLAIGLGVCATLCCFWICGLPALFLGCMALSTRRRSHASSLSAIGAIIGVLGMVCGCAAVLLLVCSLSLLAESREPGSGLLDFSFPVARLTSNSAAPTGAGGAVVGREGASQPGAPGGGTGPGPGRKQGGAGAKYRNTSNSPLQAGVSEVASPPKASAPAIDALRAARSVKMNRRP